MLSKTLKALAEDGGAAGVSGGDVLIRLKDWQIGSQAAGTKG